MKIGKGMVALIAMSYLLPLSALEEILGCMQTA
jgi:hypothetical protein